VDSVSFPRGLSARKRRAEIHIAVVRGSIQPMLDALLYLIPCLSIDMPPRSKDIHPRFI
jgi:hypothetical protein